ncbi:hypothetical protein BT63DRAFT_448601 [Microthyrium microscopicum]|uniref:Uncharacterized protein n=1 Tax=Microthyrium microscopicum TaxID=703497 RepID=A0A6A6TX41_9PEZI|nr:hypothetical protein BT63DRAFT_448601 [Microthyrium microscopicum]
MLEDETEHVQLIPSAVREHLPDHIPRPALPDSIALQKLNPFAAPVHTPPAVQSNSSAGDSKWHADWHWLLPFSYDVTRDHERALLPPVQLRPPIYTFYEPSKKSSSDVQKAEERLIFQWRRAWYAQGFMPRVLGRPDAMQNPKYRTVQQLGLQDNIEREFARWLAWENMGGGIITDWVTFPMADYNNALLSFLRRGQYPKLTRYERLKGGLFCGDKDVVKKGIASAIKQPDVKKALNFADKMFADMFSIDSGQDGVAFYDSDTISKKYKDIATPLFGSDRAKGLRLLGNLINAHLHGIWHATFTEVAVLKPMAKSTTAMVDPALYIAGNLTSCPPSNPMQSSCPPNQPNCKRCVSSQPVPIATPSSFRNTTEKFFIGIVPHPYTTASLTSNRDAIDAAFVRRLGHTGRDMWLTAVTSASQKGTNAAKLSVLKSAVASNWAAGRTLWVTAEHGLPESELQWIFGFSVPHEGVDVRVDAKSETPVPGPERRPRNKEDEDEGKARPEAEKLVEEKRLLGKAKSMVTSKSGPNKKVREAVEGWNMGDSEAWRFVRAFNARRTMLRKHWEKEERKFAGSDRAERGKWGRWFD